MWAVYPQGRHEEQGLPGTVQRVTLDVHKAFVPTSSPLLCCPVTLWGKWGWGCVLEIQKPRVKVGDEPEATRCSVVTPGLCPSSDPSTSGCSEEPSWSLPLRRPLSGGAGRKERREGGLAARPWGSGRTARPLGLGRPCCLSPGRAASTLAGGKVVLPIASQQEPPAQNLPRQVPSPRLI